MFSHSTMNSNGLLCPAMEPSYSHSSQDSMHSSFTTTTNHNNNAFYPDLDIPLSESPIDSFYDYDFSSPPNSQYAFPDMDLDTMDMYPVTTNTSYAMPVPCPQPPPQYYNPSPFSNFSTSIPSSTSSPSSSLSTPPLQWSLGDESNIPRFSLAPPEPSPKSKPFPCACGRAFTRPADLKRHQTSVHFPVFQDCPVAECSRKDRNGFPRRDHLIEHLRSYHHLNIPKGASKRAAKARSC